MIVVVVTAPGRPHVGNLEHRLRGHQACFVDDSKREGTVVNHWRALRVARDICERYRLEQILICQDDIELCAGALEYIEAFPVPDDLALLAWFDGEMPQYDGRHPLPQVVRNDGVLWLQAATWPARTIRRLLDEWPRPPGWWTPKHGVDDLLSCLLGRLRWAVHLPNLAEHVGAVSLVDSARTLTGNRISKNYPGADFDARTLWAGKAVGHG